jgi:LuxR family maltose regulon positive regulatory protein
LRLIQVRALAAIAAHRSGDALGALAAVVDAVSLAAPQGVMRSLVDEGPAFQEVVAFGMTRMPSWRAEGEAGHFVRSLLDTHKPADVVAGPLPHRFPTPQFTAKEADVMRLLSGGHSNRAIADRLAMAPDTVKWHLKNIFGKLSVSNRTQAVLRLQELGLAQPGSGSF